MAPRGFEVQLLFVQRTQWYVFWPSSSKVAQGYVFFISCLDTFTQLNGPKVNSCVCDRKWWAQNINNATFNKLCLDLTWLDNHSLEKFLETSMVVRMAPLSLRRALNFFRQSTVSCLCTTDATRSRCWNYGGCCVTSMWNICFWPNTGLIMIFYTWS